MSNYIYLMQEKDLKNSNKKIYKLGKTKQENVQKLKKYSKGSKLILQQVCSDHDKLEIELINYFKEKYIHRKDIGNGYFEGDYNEMIKDIQNKISNNIIIDNKKLNDISYNEKQEVTGNEKQEVTENEKQDVTENEKQDVTENEKINDEDDYELV